MTEDEARGWCLRQFGNRGVDRLNDYVDLLLAESERQNLIAPSTKACVWVRHIVDSAQLLLFAPSTTGRDWIDVGSGGGLPGLVIAAASDWPVMLIEPRRLRADFLVRASEALGLAKRVTVQQSNADQVRRTPAAVISARAVARLDKLFTGTRGFADLSTTFLLPKGASARSDLEDAVETWQGSFHVEHSITDAAAGIIVATQVGPR